MQAERGATLIPAVNANIWAQGIATRVALYRDWMWSDGIILGIRLAAVQKVNGKVDADALEQAFAYDIQSVLHHGVPAISCAYILSAYRLVWFLWSMLWSSHREQSRPRQLQSASWTKQDSRCLTAKTSMVGQRRIAPCCLGDRLNGRAVKILSLGPDPTATGMTTMPPIWTRDPTRRTTISKPSCPPSRFEQDDSFASKSCLQPATVAARHV